MEIVFTKMHGLGNDFIMVDSRESTLPDPGGFAARYCDRRFGIGADQLIVLYPSARADFRMGIFNADGGEVEMCGNGLRCLAKYIWDRGLAEKPVLDIETLAGIIRPERDGELIKVDMGEPVFEPEKIPVALGQGSMKGPIIDYPLRVKDREFRITCVSMGNPHAVIFLEGDPEQFSVSLWGPEIENHPFFPRRTNVEFVHVRSKDTVAMRVWERGAGETLACGTGACAAGVASMLKGLTDKRVTLSLLGGDLLIEWKQNNHVSMTGPAVEVFEGKMKV